MLYSTATGYALRALTVLPEDGSYALTKQLAAQLELPGPYLAKILQVLAQKGLLRSLRGPRGGFQLARPASEINVGQVLEAMEGSASLAGCVMGFSACGPDSTPCPLHDAWKGVKAHLEGTLAQITMTDLRARNLEQRFKDVLGQN